MSKSERASFCKAALTKCKLKARLPQCRAKQQSKCNLLLNCNFSRNLQTLFFGVGPPSSWSHPVQKNLWSALPKENSFSFFSVNQSAIKSKRKKERYVEKGPRMSSSYSEFCWMTRKNSLLEKTKRAPQLIYSNVRSWLRSLQGNSLSLTRDGKSKKILSILLQ